MEKLLMAEGRIVPLKSSRSTSSHSSRGFKNQLFSSCSSETVGPLEESYTSSEHQVLKSLRYLAMKPRRIIS